MKYSTIKRLYMLNSVLLGDTMNRLDNLILEIRHIQGNIIRQLREPVLYKFLQYEEDYIWGTYPREDQRRNGPLGNDQQDSDGVDSSDNKKSRIATSWLDYLEKEGVASVGEITKCWIMALPNTKAKKNEYSDGITPRFGSEKNQSERYLEYFNWDNHNKIYDEINHVFLRRNIAHGWGPELTAHYNCLVAAQALKRDILSDKITLTHWAHRALAIDKAKENSGAAHWHPSAVQAIGRFVTIRSGIMFYMREYLSRIKDLRAPVERELNFSTVEYPHPMTSKRREQGFYTEFLSERAAKYFKARLEILSQTGDINRKEFHSPLILHRWKHSAESSCEIYKDEILSAPTRSGKADKDPLNPHNLSVPLCFVNSSFWMSERPDLQPGIAREVSRYFVEDVFGNIGEADLKYSSGSMAELIRNLSKVFYSYRDRYYTGDRFPVANLEIIREIAADLIASSRNSHSYLWTVFLDTIGRDMYEALETPHSECDLSIITEAEHAHHALQYDQTIEAKNHLWSVRLVTLVHWVQGVGVTNKKNPYAEELVKGILELVDILLEYVETYSPLNIADGRGADFFKRLTNHLRDEIKCSKALEKVQEQQESCIASSLEPQIQSNELPIDKLLPQIFSDKFDEWLKSVKATRRGDHQSLKSLTGCTKKNKKYSFLSSVQDISWTLHMLRGEDMLLQAAGDPSNRSITRNVLLEIFQDFNPGYDFYSVALEVHIWLRSRPIRILSRVVRVVGEYVIAHKDTEDEGLKLLLIELLAWLTGGAYSVDNLKTEIEKFEEDFFIGVKAGKRSGGTQLAKESAISLIQKSGSSDKTDQGFSTRNQDRIRELDCLREILTDQNYSELSMGISSLKSYLEVTPSAIDAEKKKDNEKENQDILDERIKSVAEGFSYIGTQSSEVDNQSQKTLFSAPLTLLHITVCEARNRHAVSNLFPDPKTPFFSKNHGEVGQTKTRYAAHYALMLGRHDLLGIAESNYLSYTRELELGEDGQSHKPYTVRAERALPFKLFDGKNVSNRKDLSSLCAAMHIKLTGRDSRLNFLLRIKEGLKEDKVDNEDPLVTVFRSEFKADNCVALLTEGSNDIVLLFFFDAADIKDEEEHADRDFEKTEAYSKSDIHDKLKKVFRVRKAIHQDFLVESVETVPSAICMDLFSVGEENKCFSFEVSLRLRSDRSLEKSIEEAEKDLSKAVQYYQSELDKKHPEASSEEDEFKNELAKITKQLADTPHEATDELKKRFEEKLKEIYAQRQKRVMDTFERSLNTNDALEKNILHAHHAPPTLPKWQRTPGRVDYNLTLDSHLANAIFCGKKPGDNFQILYKLSGRLPIEDKQGQPVDLDKATKLSKLIDEVITKINYEGCADESSE
jgi:hypothetical protein